MLKNKVVSIDNTYYLFCSKWQYMHYNIALQTYFLTVVISIISHFDYFITFLDFICRTGNYLYIFTNIKQDISHSLLGSKKSDRFCKHHFKKCHL